MGNWINGSSAIDGLLRDQGECSDPEKQAGNKFSAYDSDPATIEHLYFDDNSIGGNGDFRYSDMAANQPDGNEVNTPAFLNNCAFLVYRECQPLSNCGLPCLQEREDQHKMLIDEIEDQLATTTDPAEIAVLNNGLSHERGYLNVTFNSEARNILEGGVLDSLESIYAEGEGITEKRQLVDYYTAKEQFTEASELIDEIISEEGGEASYATAMQQLQLQVGSSFNPPGAEEEETLESWVEVDPLGAMSAKALLSQLRGRPYSRVPWMINDTIAGLKSTAQATNEVVASNVVIWPNPTTGLLNLSWSKGMLRSIEAITPDGRTIQLRFMVNDEMAQVDVQDLRPGAYALRVRLDDRSVVRRVLVVKAP